MLVLFHKEGNPTYTLSYGLICLLNEADKLFERDIMGRIICI